MEETRIILAGLWVALMLTYLLGDVLRIFAGDFTAGEIDGQEASQWMWMLAAIVMLIPIVMICALAHAGVPGDPVGQHRCGGVPRPVQYRRPPVSFRVRQLPHRRGVRVQRFHHLVRLDVDVMLTLNRHDWRFADEASVDRPAAAWLIERNAESVGSWNGRRPNRDSTADGVRDDGALQRLVGLPIGRAV